MSGPAIRAGCEAVPRPLRPGGRVIAKVPAKVVAEALAKVLTEPLAMLSARAQKRIAPMRARKVRNEQPLAREGFSSSKPPRGGRIVAPL